MQLNVQVIPNAKQNKIVKEGKANKALVELLAEYFKVKKNQIIIARGRKSRNKVLEIQK